MLKNSKGSEEFRPSKTYHGKEIRSVINQGILISEYYPFQRMRQSVPQCVCKTLAICMKNKYDAKNHEMVNDEKCKRKTELKHISQTIRTS